MLLILFIVLLALSVILIWLGHSHEEGLYSLAGFFFLFLLGFLIVLPGNLAIQAGENVTITTINETTTEIHAPNYTNFSDTISHSFGIWISLTAIFGFALTLTEIRSGVDKG